MAEQPRNKQKSALPIVMALAVAAGLARMVVQKLKQDKAAEAGRQKDAGAAPPA